MAADDKFEEALAPGEERFVVKPRKSGRNTTYQVYDLATASIPVSRVGFGVVEQDHATPEGAAKEAQRLTDYYAKEG